MKWALAVLFLLLSFASIAFADGSGIPPTQNKPPKPVTLQLADGSGIPPTGTPNPTKPLGSEAA